MTRWIVLGLLLGAWLSAPVRAQTSDYEDRLVDNLSLINSWQSYLSKFPAKPNLAPPQDVAALATAVAQVYAAFHDDHQSEHEPRLRDEFEQMVVAGFVSQYPVVRERLKKTGEVLAAGRSADATNYEFRRERLKEMVQWHYFALPLLLYEGSTPYQEMYRDALALHVQAGGARPDLDLTGIQWPSVRTADLGSTEVVSISESRRREEAARQARRAAQTAQIERENAARQADIATEVAAAQAAAQAEVAAELARAQELTATAMDNARADASGSGFFWLVLLLVLGSGGFFAYRRGLIPAALAQRSRELATQKLAPLKLKDKESS
ncbi:MAG: hypothetical protein AAGA23_01080 [Pseudomonadota bacterium]